MANRVNEIQELTKDYSWFYINTNDNPADIISRGVMPDNLKTCTLWWNGPEILKTNYLNPIFPDVSHDESY